MNDHQHAAIQQARIIWHGHQFEHDCYGQDCAEDRGCTAPTRVQSAVMDLNRIRDPAAARKSRSLMIHMPGPIRQRQPAPQPPHQASCHNNPSARLDG